MTKITAEHLSRSAFVYVRQSTADQLVHNQESSRRQHGLAERARQLGWTAVEVIDDDLDRSGGGVNRPGFERLLAAICEGRVGACWRSIWSGGFVGTIVPPPATLLLNAPQYATGKALTDAAVAHINAKLGGIATVVLLTQDTMQFLTPRFEAMRDGLSKLPGVTIVADIAPSPVDKRSGFHAMNTILLANPDVDVVLGGDAVVLGALQALRAAGKDRLNQFLGGIDGEPEAVSEIKKADSPYKASIALSSPVFGYAMGQFAADWLEGRSVPQAMDILPIALTHDNIAQYEADLADPAPAFIDHVRRSAYLRMYGNICYDTRNNYVNFPWSSEQE